MHASAVNRRCQPIASGAKFVHEFGMCGIDENVCYVVGERLEIREEARREAPLTLLRRLRDSPSCRSTSQMRCEGTLVMPTPRSSATLVSLPHEIES